MNFEGTQFSPSQMLVLEEFKIFTFFFVFFQFAYSTFFPVNITLKLTLKKKWDHESHFCINHVLAGECRPKPRGLTTGQLFLDFHPASIPGVTMPGKFVHDNKMLEATLISNGERMSN